jgi:predicted secreted protein
MASTGFVKGTDLLVYIDYNTAVAYSKTCTLNMTMSTSDTTNKDDLGWKGVLPQLRDWTIDGDGLYNYSGNVTTLFAMYNNRTRVSLRFTNRVTGDKYYTGYAYLTALSISAPDKETATFSFTFTGDSTLSEYACT